MSAPEGMASLRAVVEKLGKQAEQACRRLGKGREGPGGDLTRAQCGATRLMAEAPQLLRSSSLD